VVLSFVSERDNLVFNLFRNFKPVKRFQNSSDVLEFWSLGNSSSKSILGVLETIYLIFWKTIVQRVAVVKLGVYDRGGSVKVKVGTDTTESTNVMIAGSRQCGDLIRKGKMCIKCETMVASRLISVC